MRLLADLPKLEAGTYQWAMPMKHAPQVKLSAEDVRAIAALGVVFPGAKAVGWRDLRVSR